MRPPLRRQLTYPSVQLDFIKRGSTSSGTFTCTRDPRSAEEVGTLLEEHQVGRVVLNACRSTHQSGPGGTIPRVLRRHGVHEIVAMAYQVSSRCVQYFTSWFYAILFTARDLPSAVACGRRSLERSAERLSRFGAKLQIMDHMMPVCYQSQEWIQRDKITEIFSTISKLDIDNDSPEDEPSLVFGREHDLLKLECMLLEGGRPVLVVGEPGIGKTVLLAVLAQWWSATGCAVATHTVQLSQDKAFTVDKMCRDLHKVFKCPDPYNGQESIVSFLRATRFLVVIDSLESMTVGDSTNLGRQHGALMRFIRALNGGETVGKTILLIGSRREHSFLSSCTSTFRLSGLKTIPAMQLMRALLNLSRKNVMNVRSMDSMKLLTRMSSTTGIDTANENSSDLLEHIEALKQRTDSGLRSLFPSWDSDEDGVYLEEIHKLVNGHPLALGLLTRNMSILGPDVSPKRFMLALLQGAPMITSREGLSQGNDEEIEGLRSLDDLDRMISDLQTDMPFHFKHLIGLLATFWKVVPTRCLHLFQKFQLKESVNSVDTNSEIIAMSDKLESLGLAKNMSPSLKESLVKIRTEKLDVMKEMQVQVEFCEYLEAEGLFTKVPEIKPVLKAMRETLSQNLNIDPAVIKIDEALHSHEGTFIFTNMRDILLEKSDGLDAEAREAFRSWDSWEDVLAALPSDGPATELCNLLKSTQSSVLRTGLNAFVVSHLIDIPQSDQPQKTETGMGYIRTSPLLTIMLRGHDTWYGDEVFAASNKVALALFYAHRCQVWPTPFPATGTPAWNLAKAEADIEFYNLASAAAISKDQLRDMNRGFIVESVMMDTVLKLDWCSMINKTSVPIVQMLWELCFDEAQEIVKTLESSKDRPRRRKWVESFLPQPSEEDIPFGQRQTELRLFGRRSASIVLAMCLLRFYNHFDDQRTRRCSDIIKSTIKSIKTDSYPLEIIQRAMSSLKWIIDLGERVATSSVSKSSSKHKMTAQEIARIIEEQRVSASAASAGKENTANSPDLNACRVDPQTFAAVATQFQDNIQEIHRHVNNGNYDAARELLDAAFEEEFEYGQNDKGRRSTLLFFNSIVNAKQGRLSDALRDLDEYRRLSSTAGGGKDWTISMGTRTSLMRRSLAWALKLESRSKVHQNTRLEPCACCYKQRGVRRCLGCLYTLYCSAECQKNHWKNHKKVCKSFGSGYSL